MELTDLKNYRLSAINIPEYRSILDDLEEHTAGLASSALANLNKMNLDAANVVYDRVLNAEKDATSRLTKMLEEARVLNYSDLMANVGISPDLKQTLDSLSSTHLNRALQSFMPVTGPESWVLRPRFDMSLHSIAPGNEIIEDDTNNVTSSMQELGLRLEKQMAADGANQIAHTKQEIKILENLVTLIAASSAANEQANKQNHRLNRIILIIAIVAAIAGIGQWITPILMHYLAR